MQRECRGTMGNLLCLAAQCQRGDEIILGTGSHIFVYEGGGCSAHLGISMHTIPNLENGALDVEAIQQAIRDDDPHYPRTTLVAIENTQHIMGGKAIPASIVEDIGQVCRYAGLKYHVDGARICNASVALKTSIQDLVRPVDSLSMCLSKGLGAPVGSVIAGTNEMIYHARRARKVFGGGMRQSGLLAAAGLFALENNFKRLAQDHEHATTLAEGLVRC